MAGMARLNQKMGVDVVWVYLGMGNIYISGNKPLMNTIENAQGIGLPTEVLLAVT